jgi:hypothetical protein
MLMISQCPWHAFSFRIIFASMDNLKVVSLGQALALIINNRLDWKGLLGNLTYYLGPCVNIIKHFVLALGK